MIEGGEAQLLCNISGEPPPIVSWQLNGIPIETGMRYVVEDKVKFIFLLISDMKKITKLSFRNLITKFLWEI